ncbi:DsbA family protein [Zavarzinia aquatilis]|uniref:2-hydroxychromene-2-carboxylate isomerase n=1 Tax=Zavarzinia aquatilis TaxID=2211142 RepID=A0A317E9U6_9PROT|nr:DsbA family protein [Zavarzinia aquatilis]PWR22920.1 2-hydroxychromene-2-carboxylate isomerase [Zavarzinia aquatilis]
MSLRRLLAREASRLVTSERLNVLRRRVAEGRRRLRRKRHEIDYFHDIRDPYSLLAAMALPALAARRGVSIRPHLVPPPPDWAAPERAMLDAYARKDAASLAAHLGLAVPDLSAPMDEAAARAGEWRLLQAMADGSFIASAAALTAEAWRGEVPPGSGDSTAAVAAGAALREKLGHYLGATFHYAGEWYWGLDRLHYLEQRLETLGARRRDAGPAIQHPREALRLPTDCKGRLAGRRLELFLSFRSPYSYIVLPRAFALADHYGATLDLRFVLPMVTRGLPVPMAKRLYIVRDTAREARSEALPFGRIADPLGEPVARGLAILAFALRTDQAKARAFALSFLQGVFADGIDAGSEAGLRQLVERAGLDWSHARTAMADEGWRATAETNRQAMVDEGLWGVPSLRFGETATWGQDRLWLIEDAMIRAARGTA